MKWNFPLINPRKKFPLIHYLNHVYEELDEYRGEPRGSLKQAKEVIDVLHAAETLVRKFFEENSQFDLEAMRQSTIRKNDARGYYKD